MGDPAAWELADYAKTVEDLRAENDRLSDQLSDVRQAPFERTRLMDEMQDERDEYRDLLKDILDCEAEFEAIGGGPGFKERRAKAFAAAWERFEP